MQRSVTKKIKLVNWPWLFLLASSIWAHLLPTTSAVLDCVLRFHLDLATNAFCRRGAIDGSDMMARVAAPLALDVEILELGVLLRFVGELWGRIGSPVVVPAGGLC